MNPLVFQELDFDDQELFFDDESGLFKTDSELLFELDGDDELFDEFSLGPGLRFGGSDTLDDEICQGFKIDSTSYVKWVQRSLNRLQGSRLHVDGRVSAKYTAAVRHFQQRMRLKVTGLVDRKTQNKMILSNEKNRTYVRWIQNTLNFNGERLIIDGIMGPKTKGAVKRFQKRAPGLCVDGFVGAKTELRLIQAGGNRPSSGVVIQRSCSLPQRTFLDEIFLELDVEDMETASPAVRVRPRLCLFQNVSDSRERNHFDCGARRQARRVGAIASPDAARCRRRVGPTPYNTGADIITAIEAARACLRRVVDRVDVFSHGYSLGIPGNTIGAAGLYRSDVSPDRSDGGRSVADVPTSPLSENVIFVLHGCNMASGTNNVARSLYEHLAGSLSNPNVYGHYNGGCAGRNNSWRRYSNSSPSGRRLSSLPNIASSRCCGA